ncbi:hypothetical protein [Breoghania sp.]|uniref:hypothetical protein n=1 Tax=Breoghania sp. TaxID=2065378 RepID=UPI002AAACBD3|nr:hypothetical protein [Breoghania sp.]
MTGPVGDLAAIQALIGTPYDIANRAPRLNCWGCFVVVQGLLGRALDAIRIEGAGAAELARMIASHNERARWREIAGPVHGCGVLMGRSRAPIHIGTWLDIDGGGVIHAHDPAGVVFERLPDIKAAGWRHVTFHEIDA